MVGFTGSTSSTSRTHSHFKALHCLTSAHITHTHILTRFCIIWLERNFNLMKYTNYTVYLTHTHSLHTFIIPHTLTDNSTCLFDPGSPLYTQELRETLRPIDSLVLSCADLAEFWTYLIGLMSLCFVGFVISVISIISNCVVPCVEGRYEKGSDV